MRLPRNRTLLVIVVVLVVAWFCLRHWQAASTPLPWNQGQAGSIFGGGMYGGGQ